MKNMLAKAIRIASVEFEDEFDKGENPYILHCLWVMNKVRHLGIDYMIVAVLHDLIEDTNWTSEKLLSEGFSKIIVEAIEALTKDETKTYEFNIQRALSNEIARQVKLRDLEHNSKITRLKGVSEKDLQRIGKYHKAYKVLEPYRK